MEEQSEIVRSKKEFAFASSTILSQVGRGIIVGLIVGIIVGSFRFLIEKGFHLIQGVYQDQGYLVRNLFVLVLFVGLSLFITLKNSYNIFLKNYNFLEKYTSLCYTTSILTYGENT